MRARIVVALFCTCALTALPAAAQSTGRGMSSGTGELDSTRVHSDEAIPVGPFIFSPTLQLSWQHRDNIFFTPDDEVADQVLLIRGQLLFEIPVYESYVRFSYTPQYRDYREYSLEDNWQHFFDAAAAFEFS
ncbi:MAG TPA: hypothetical protein VLT32_07595, partial [Candidatus Sulfomarinibacteraceae bacterium]|nr:hypothetical protein [Candidatus Sulfomarinibacteraceae bacterium]